MFAIENTKPGLTVVVNAGQVARAVERQPSSTGMFVGYAGWGPPDSPVVLTSWGDYVRAFGGFNANSYLDDAVYSFFQGYGGTTAVVVRVTGATASVSTLTILDRRAVGAAGLIRLDGKYPSSSVDVRATIENGTLAGTFRLIVRSGLLEARGVRREIFDNMLADANSIAFINQTSNMGKVTLLANTAVAPDNLPALTAEALLAGGSDDFAGLNDGRFIGTVGATSATGLQALGDAKYGTGQVCVPGITSAAVRAALSTHAETWHRYAVIDPPLGSDKAAVAAIRATMGTSYSGLYWPWVQVNDFDGSGLLKYLPPSCFIPGECAKADRTEGTQRAPANLGPVPFSVDVENFPGGMSQTDDATLAWLTRQDVNVILPIRNQGVRVYGARVAAADRRIQFVHEARMMNMLYYSAHAAYSWAPFSTVDGSGRLFRDLASAGRQFLEQLQADGALYGTDAEPGFSVVADENNNPAADLANGIVRVQWIVKLSSTAERVTVFVDNVALFQQLSVLARAA
jgi:phage tail sheath protein FI